MPSVEPVLRPRRLLEELVRHEVRFVLIGGVAERILGSPRTTNDLDICPAMDASNRSRLAAALNDLEAGRPVGGGRLPLLRELRAQLKRE